MINMAFMPLYMSEMWDVTPVTDGRTDSGKVEHYSVWTESAILELKVNVKFFTVDPYTPYNRVSRPFPIWSIWQIWPLLGQKNMFFGGIVNWGNEIWIVFGWFQGFLGHQNDFWKFQKLSKFLTKNSVKNTGNFTHFSWPTEPVRFPRGLDNSQHHSPPILEC